MVDDDFPTPGRLRIGVAGATGRIGSYLMKGLIDKAVNVVALTRDPHPERLPHALDRAVVDFSEPNTLAKALDGVDRLFLAQGTSSDQVRNEIALINAAASAGVSHIVKVSAMGPPTRLHPFDWHMEIEGHLAKYDIGYTVLRASTFVDILINRAARAVAAGTWGGAAGDGRVNLIDIRDVADVALVSLLDERHIGTQRAYHLTGPRAVSMQDVADELTRLIGREVKYRQRTPSEQRDVLVASGASEMVIDIMLGLDRVFHDSILSETTDTVMQLIGRPPRSLETWLAEHVGAFIG